MPRALPPTQHITGRRPARRSAPRIVVAYQAVDGFAQRRVFYTLAGARRYAQERVGAHPDLGAWYAVSFDGVGRVTVEGATLADLFPAPEAPATERTGSQYWTVDEDGSDSYTGEDDLTEQAIENANDLWASMTFGNDPEWSR